STSGGTGSGYASMLSLVNATKPPASRPRKITTIRTRCRSAKPMTAFMARHSAEDAGGRLPSGPSWFAAGSSAVDEDAAARHDLFARLEPLQHLDEIAAAQPQLDAAKLQRLVLERHPHAGGIALVDDCLARHGRRCHLVGGEDRDAGEHLG